MYAVPPRLCARCGTQLQEPTGYCRRCKKAIGQPPIGPPPHSLLDDPHEDILENEPQRPPSTHNFISFITNVFSSPDSNMLCLIMLIAFVFFCMILVLVFQPPQQLPAWLIPTIPFGLCAASIIVALILRLRKSGTRQSFLKSCYHICIYLAISLLLLGFAGIYNNGSHNNFYLLLILATLPIAPVFFTVAIDMDIPYYAYPSMAILTVSCIAAALNFPLDFWWYPTVLLFPTLLSLILNIVFNAFLQPTVQRYQELFHHLRLCSQALKIVSFLLLILIVIGAFLSPFVGIFSNKLSVGWLLPCIGYLFFSLLWDCFFLRSTRRPQFRQALLYMTLALLILVSYSQQIVPPRLEFIARLTSNLQQIFPTNQNNVLLLSLVLLYLATRGLISQSVLADPISKKDKLIYFMKRIQYFAMSGITVLAVLYVTLINLFPVINLTMDFGLLLLAFIVYLIGFLERKYWCAWLASLLALSFLISHFITSQGEKDLPPLLFLFAFSIFCYGIGISLKGIEKSIATWLKLNWSGSAQRAPLQSYSNPLYSIALLSAISVGIFGYSFVMNKVSGQPRGFILLACVLFLYALLTSWVALIEKHQIWNWLVAGFAIWALYQGREPMLLPLVLGLGVGAGLIGLFISYLYQTRAATGNAVPNLRSIYDETRSIPLQTSIAHARDICLNIEEVAACIPLRPTLKEMHEPDHWQAEISFMGFKFTSDVVREIPDASRIIVRVTTRGVVNADLSSEIKLDDIAGQQKKLQLTIKLNASGGITRIPGFSARCEKIIEQFRQNLKTRLEALRTRALPETIQPLPSLTSRNLQSGPRSSVLASGGGSLKRIIKPDRLRQSWPWYLAVLVASGLLIFWPPLTLEPSLALPGALLVLTALLIVILYKERSTMLLIFPMITAGGAIAHLSLPLKFQLILYSLLWISAFLSQSLWRNKTSINPLPHTLLGMLAQTVTVVIVLYRDLFGGASSDLLYLGSFTTLVLAIQCFCFAYYRSQSNQSRFDLAEHIGNYVGGLLLSFVLSWALLDFIQQFSVLLSLRFPDVYRFLALPPATYLVFIMAPHLFDDNTMKIRTSFVVRKKNMHWNHYLGWGATIIGSLLLMGPLLIVLQPPANMSQPPITLLLFAKLSPSLFYGLALIGEGVVLLILSSFVKGISPIHLTAVYLKFGAYSLIPIAVVYFVLNILGASNSFNAAMLVFALIIVALVIVAFVHRRSMDES